MGMDAIPPPTENTYQRNTNKEFLKRKSKKATIAPAPSKKYNYYVDNFDENKKKEKDDKNIDSSRGGIESKQISSYEVNAPK